MCWVGLIFVCSFNVTLIALADKVLLHLVFPRCKVVYVEFLGRKSASHLSIHVELLLLLYDTNYAYCCYNDNLSQFFVNMGVITKIINPKNKDINDTIIL